jgi:hypothetical protein
MADGSGCSAPSTTPVQGNVKWTNNSGLAVTSPAWATLRIFALGSDDLVSLVPYDPGPGTGLITAIGSAQADPASPIAVAMLDDEMRLFWFSPQKELQQAILSNLTLTNVWSSPGTLPGNFSQIPSSLTSIMLRSQNVTRLFYSQGKQINSLVYSNNAWIPQDISSYIVQPGLDYGPVAAVAWQENAVRLYYPMLNGNIVEMSEDDKGLWQARDLLIRY